MLHALSACPGAPAVTRPQARTSACRPGPPSAPAWGIQLLACLLLRRDTPSDCRRRTSTLRATWAQAYVAATPHCCHVLRSCLPTCLLLCSSWWTQACHAKQPSPIHLCLDEKEVGLSKPNWSLTGGNAQSVGRADCQDRLQENLPCAVPCQAYKQYGFIVGCQSVAKDQHIIIIIIMIMSIIHVYVNTYIYGSGMVRERIGGRVTRNGTCIWTPNLRVRVMSACVSSLLNILQCVCVCVCVLSVV